MSVPVKQLDNPKKCRVGTKNISVGISSVALDAGVIINLPKFKSHQQLVATFAVKNMFGCVSGKRKALWHFTKGHHQNEFCELLIDIYKYLNPALTIIDAVTAMDGPGPIRGRPRPLGFLLGGTDPIACETICAKLIGIERFMEKSPVSVMARGLLERVLNPKTIDEIFERVADLQYTRNLLFSVVFDLLSQVVCGSRKTLHAAYQASPQEISVSVTSVYNKVDGIETETSASLVRYCADAVAPIIDKMGGALPPLLPGYRVKILDGNCLEATEHRIR